MAGFLQVDGSGATVHLEGMLGSEKGLQDAVVYGRLLVNGQRVSLLNTFTTSRRLSEQGVTTTRIHSTIAAFGCHEVMLAARAIEFRLPYCASWFHEDTFEVDFSCREEDVVVRFAAFKTFSYELAYGYKLERSYSATVPGGNWGSERLDVGRPMRFKLTAPSIVPFDTLWEKMRQVQRFFEFLSRNRMPPTHLALWADPAPDSWGADVTLYLHDSKTSRGVDGWDDHLVRHPDVSSRLGEMLKAWCQLYEDAPDALARYFSAYDRDGEDAVLHFLWNAVAVEELHKVRTGERRAPGFLERIRQTVLRWKDAFETLPEEAVLAQIRDTRNYYAHGAGDLREKASKEWVLLRQAYFLQALSTLEMLVRLGLSKDEVGDIARRRYWMREMLGLRMFPG
jgi:hypothetical protein